MLNLGHQVRERTRCRRIGWRARALLFFVFPCCLLSTKAEADHEAPTETTLKSAFLYKFTHFVDWPLETLGKAGDPFAMCVLGRDELADVLEHAVNGRTARNRPLVVRRIESVDEASQCHLLFIGWSKPERIERILGALGQQPTLTVGDTKGFARNGGMINLTREGKRLGFEINRRAAERADIHLSSQLLKLANLIDEDGGEE